ncbi:hypothetical protein [Bradyrhizobium erythrophlei]|uniref:Microcystin-dependent protein n=1 Tax=Bradyrhizobium erythrophlei TaxID=1437360 RepID=A0A1M7TEF0_9BRAD|nr:hypothetical protein [Bradyrhizobium erythrophlei]SHN69132.1 hypothetical protein SAMN05444170_1500 [Bradyrhizobium erythrophlei]
MILLFANNAVSTIASPLTPTSVSVQVAPGTGALFPQPIVGQQFFKLTFVDALTGLENEIVHVTQVVGDVFTIVRGQEGTQALSWLVGDAARNMTTAGTQSNFIQVQQAQAGATNTAVDTGTPNSYVAALSPVVTTRIFGLLVRIKAANSNTGASTLNIGAGSFPITNPDGSALGAGAIIAGGFFEVVDDGVENYQLISSSQQAQSTAGAATTGDIKFRPTSESIAGWIVANATTIGNTGSNATQLAGPTAANLFAWHWNNFSNTQAPVFTSAGVPTTRGANAAADFAALKQIEVLDLRGTAMYGMDTMGAGATTLLSGVPVVSGAANLAGSILGENLHALIKAELAAHNHGGATGGMSANDPHSHTVNAYNNGGGAGITTGGVAQPITPQTLGTTTASVAHTHSISNDGSGAAHNNAQRGIVGFVYIKL